MITNLISTGDHQSLGMMGYVIV